MSPDSTEIVDRRRTHQASSDPRVARTRATILDAVETLAEAGVESISVAAVVAAAGVSRSSFYTHFAGLDELSLYVLDGVFAEIGREDLGLRSAGTTGLVAARHALVHLVTHVDRRRALYRSGLAMPTSSAYHAAVDSYAQHVISTTETLSHAPAEFLSRAAATYVAGGTLGVLLRWLRADDPIPVDDLVDLLLQLQPTWLTADHESTDVG